MHVHVSAGWSRGPARRQALLLVVTVCLLAFTVSGCNGTVQSGNPPPPPPPPPAPSIAGLSVTSGPVGTPVTITGTNFGASQGSSTVKFNGTAATPTSWSAMSIVAPVPAGATSGNVTVTVGSQTSNGVNFTVTVVTPAPTISSLSVTSGPVGTPVTIRGTNFGASQGSSTVKFNGTAATPTSWSATSIVAPVPAGATTGNVTVTVGSQTSNGMNFVVTVVTPAPTISSLSVSSGPVGTPVTITGTNFGASQGSSSVKFNGTTATPTSWSATSIVAPVPAGATSGNVTVTVGSQTSNGVNFTVTVVTPAPTISSLSVTSGPVGTPVTITGTNFGASQGSSSVKFNGTTATPTSWSATSIVAPVPAGATTGNVTVTVGSQTSNGINFTVAVASTISVTVSPVRGGVTVTQPLPFSATVQGDSSGSGVTWSSSGGTLASQTTTSASFSATVAGVYTITATSKADVTKSASANIGVTDLAGVLTWRNDVSRSGINAHEYALTTQNVTTSTFAKLFSCSVDGWVFAQPLWMANVRINGATHNVVFVATENDSLYAFDADGPTCKSVWSVAKVTLIPSGEVVAVPSDVNNDSALGPHVGITGTPVIDSASQTIYLVTLTKNSSTGAIIQRLHAMDITTGLERSGSPVVISASVSGTGYDNSNGTVTFSPKMQKQRPALLLLNGVIYVCFAGFQDIDFYHGWVMAYNAATLAQVSIFNDTIDGGRGGIWMSGGGPAADSQGNIYLLTGNGDFNANTAGGRNYGDTFLKFGTSSGLAVSDWFTPFDQQSLAANDMDLGGGGAVVVLDQTSGPFPHLVLGGGKAGTLYVVNRDNLGHYNSSNDAQIVQSFVLGANGIYSAPLFWQNTLYASAVGSAVGAYPFSTSTDQFQTTPTSVSSQTYTFPGTTPSLSALGTSNAILWTIQRTSSSAILHAYDPANLKTEYWNSSQAANNRDQAGNSVKFVVPTIANGKVYIGTQTQLDVYGLLPN